MNFSPTYKLESKSCPGVTVTLRRMGPKRRAEVELSVSAARAKCREASQRYEQLDAQLQAALDAIPGYREAVAALPPDDKGERTITPALLAMIPQNAWDLSAERSAAQELRVAFDAAEIRPAMVMSALQSIDGLTTEDGQPYTAQMLCEAGPEELFAEVVAAINESINPGGEK